LKNFQEIPPNLPFPKGGVIVSPFEKGKVWKKIKRERKINFLVVQGAAKFCRPLDMVPPARFPIP
jgi:hypothetical protein